MGEQVLIDRELFAALCNYFFGGDEMDTEEREERAELIRNALGNKLERMMNNHLFTAYKTATTLAEREKLRQDYLDRRGILRDFRSETEIRYT